MTAIGVAACETDVDGNGKLKMSLMDFVPGYKSIFYDEFNHFQG